MKEKPKIRLNVILKEVTSQQENANGMAPASSIASGNIPLTRLFDVNELISSRMRFESLDEDSANKADVLQSVYESMEPAEQKLYRIWQADLEPGDDIEAIIEQLRADPNVESVEIDELNELYFTPNDPKFNDLYGLKKIQCEKAWDITQGDEEIVVAVLDTGVDYNHPDIKANMWRDINGYCGRDFSDNDNDPYDYHGHGSHVAGTIAAVGGNSIGIIGVAPKVRIMAVKIFPQAYDRNIASALKYAVDNGAKILNNSWGPTRRRPTNAVIEAAIDYVHSKGGICVFAAGNSNDETKHYSPANYGKTISVGASDKNDKRASFSNYGTKTDVAAPGTDILSLLVSTSNYVKKNGTSMACPHVAGAIALLLSKTPGMSFNAIRSKLISTGDTIKTDQPIGTRLNANKLLK